VLSLPRLLTPDDLGVRVSCGPVGDDAVAGGVPVAREGGSAGGVRGELSGTEDFGVAAWAGAGRDVPPAEGEDGKSRVGAGVTVCTGAGFPADGAGGLGGGAEGKVAKSSAGGGPPAGFPVGCAGVAGLDGNGEKSSAGAGVVGACRWGSAGTLGAVLGAEAGADDGNVLHSSLPCASARFVASSVRTGIRMRGFFIEDFIVGGRV